MKRVVHIIISILYIIWGIGAPLTAIGAILDLNIPAMISAAVGLVMLFAGIFGLFKIKPIYRRMLGGIILVGACISVAVSLGSGLQWQAIIQAVMALLYIIWG
mgnify:CR=1 FL=1